MSSQSSSATVSPTQTILHYDGSPDYLGAVPDSCDIPEKPARPFASRADTGAVSLTATLRGDPENVELAKEKITDEVIASATTKIEAAQLAKSDSSRLEWFYLGALWWSWFLLGWNDGSLGPLLPRIQEVYNVGYTVVSLLFVTYFIGFISGAGGNIWLNAKLGFGKTMLIGTCFHVAAYSVQSCAPPFPVFVLSFILAGFGSSLQNAHGNGFVGSFRRNKASRIMLLHAMYGLGAFCSPFSATYFSGVRHWSFHYLISLGIAVPNIVIQALVFKLKRQEDLLREADQLDEQKIAENSSSTSNGEDSLYRRIFSMKAVHLMTIFSFMYIGVEVSVGSWIVTFIIRERNGGGFAGYVSSGFFGGFMLGRLILIKVNQWVGEYNVIYLYMLLSIVSEITIWFIPSIIENALAVSFIGLCLGPIFPIVVGHASAILPPELFTGAIGWTTGVGVAGSAALPFITGLLATNFGIQSLQPFMVSMMCAMVCIWMLVPKRR
ncbi:hypothetical protein D9758_003096 [Tetrapyrgos nigripes]|uniref:Major facilitator superfamily (MFS) profile domain-containing protein n=1 Tax=Tetrapyrgos nigripes TaxID=182062 RepID=A0A8H5GQ98_9AGAR|nr:hypothetical protein D9758_003096 [Tetrapyrgos nigripes]